jgi:hypothetical protein
MPNDPVHILSSATTGGRINPHGGQELALMLEGIKPFAMFGQTDDMARDEVGDEEFATFVERGQLVYEGIHYPDESYTRHYYALPTETWRIKAMHALKSEDADLKFPSLTLDDYYRMVGFLLGYSKADVETFIESSRARRERMAHRQ